MRKVIIINLLALFVASAAFAESAITSGTSAAINFTTPATGLSVYGAAALPVVNSPNAPAAGTVLIGKNSTGCGTGWNTSTTAYAIETQHIQGSKAFGTSYDSTAIYQIDVSKGTPVDTAGPTTSDSGAFATNWTTM
jgi:hypothetical protein